MSSDRIAALLGKALDVLEREPVNCDRFAAASDKLEDESLADGCNRTLDGPRLQRCAPHFPRTQKSAKHVFLQPLPCSESTSPCIPALLCTVCRQLDRACRYFAAEAADPHLKSDASLIIQFGYQCIHLQELYNPQHALVTAVAKYTLTVGRLTLEAQVGHGRLDADIVTVLRKQLAAHIRVIACAVMNKGVVDDAARVAAALPPKALAKWLETWMALEECSTPCQGTVPVMPLKWGRAQGLSPTTLYLLFSLQGGRSCGAALIWPL